jgi:integrase/recombinase XerC
MNTSGRTDALAAEPRDLAARPDTVALLLADKRSPATRRAYRSDLRDFFGGDPAPETVRAFLELAPADVALRLATYKADLLARGLSEATLNRRLAALRALLQTAQRVGLAQTDGRGLIDGEKVRPYRDTRGPDLRALRRLLAAPDGTLRGMRDRAILRVLCENALRRAEVCALDVRDFFYSARRLMIAGKGRGTQKEPVTLSPKCADAIAAYLVAAGHATDAEAPLFRNCEHRPGHAGGRLTGDGLYFLCRSYGRAIGLPNLTPHQLRHAAITLALDATRGDVRRVQRLSRHADLRTLTIYDDNRTDLQGEVSALLSGLL